MRLLATGVETTRQLFEFAGLPEGWGRFALLLIFATMCYWSVLLYHREKRAGASRTVRVSLAAVRCALLAMLSAIWIEPVIATYVTRTLTARVAVLVDTSASMAVADVGEAGEDAAARSARVGRLLDANDFRWLRRLAERNELVMYEFAEQATRKPLPWRPASAPATAASGEISTARTDIGQAAASAIDEFGSSPIAGLVVITDGGVNKGMTFEEIGNYARRSKARMFIVGVGQPIEPPNLRVVSIIGPQTVSKGDPFELRVQLAATDISAAQVELELTVETAGEGATASGAERTIERRQISLTQGVDPPAELFRITPDTPGEFIYRAKVMPLPGEAIAGDNFRETSVVVLDDRLRVLIVAGRPSYDYRAITTLFERDRTIDVSCWLQSADERAVRDGDTVITELPRKPEDLFSYDAILLLDANPAELDEAFAISLRRFVDEFGGGVLFEAGQQYSSRFLVDARLSEFVSVLPVSPDPEADIRLSDQGTFRARPFPMAVEPENAGHPLLTLHPDDAINRQIWSRLPGVFWFLPVLREKPAATVLLRHSSAAARAKFGPPILFAVQPVGSGRCAFLAFDSTWRWRSTAEAQFNRFWVRNVRYLSQARRESGSQRGTIILDRENISVGDFVKIEARVLDARFVPWTEPKIEATLDFADGTSRPFMLEALAGREGWFGARIHFDRDGPVLIRVPLPGGDATTAPAGPVALTKRVRVQRPDIELRTLRLHEDELARLAEETGGEYVRLADAEALPDRIQNATRVDPPRRAGPPGDLWDRAWIMYLIASLLAAEWTIRRRNHLL